MTFGRFTDGARPLVLRWRERPLVLAFTTAEAAGQFIGSIDVQRVDGATQVGLGSYECVLEQEIRSGVHSSLPEGDHLGLLVAVEGHDLFPAILQSWEY